MSAVIRMPPLARESIFWWRVFVAWFVLLFGLSSIGSIPAGAPQVMVSDKLAHAACFTAGAAALFWALTLGDRPWIAANGMLAPIACLAAAALVGWFDEWHQSHTPGRSGNDLGDWLADLTGGLLGYLLGRFGFPLLDKRERGVETGKRADH